MTKIDDMLTTAGAAAERAEVPDPLPDGITVTRPNMTRPTVVSVRLSGDEHARLAHAAELAHLPVSTLIRVYALDRLDAEQRQPSESVADRLARLEQAVFQRPESPRGVWRLTQTVSSTACGAVNRA